MSVLRVNEVVNSTDDGPVEFTQGVSIPENTSITGDIVVNSSGIVTASTLSLTEGLNVSGVTTASSFFGDGSQITGISEGTTTGKAITLTLIS